MKYHIERACQPCHEGGAADDGPSASSCSHNSSTGVNPGAVATAGHGQGSDGSDLCNYNREFTEAGWSGITPPVLKVILRPFSSWRSFETSCFLMSATLDLVL